MVELLVVIGIVGILASLLLPALARGRAAAKRAACASNLRQLGLAAQMYWDDHAGLAFRYRRESRPAGDLYWFGWIARGAEGEREFDPKQGALYPYLENRPVELCPAFHSPGRAFKLKATGRSHGYGYNLCLSSPKDRPPVNVHQIRNPSSLVLLGDAAQVNTFQPPASPSNPLLEEFYYLSTNEPTAHFRHSGRLNAVFCDGHVAAAAPLEGSFDPRLPKAKVGRLPPESLIFNHE